MRVVKIFSSIVFGGIIILAIGGYFFVRNFDLNKYKVYVEEYAKQYQQFSVESFTPVFTEFIANDEVVKRMFDHFEIIDERNCIVNDDNYILKNNKNNIKMNDVTIDYGICITDVTASLTDVVITHPFANTYSLWIVTGADVTITGSKIQATGDNGRAIKISYEDADSSKVTKLKVSETEFISSKKSAILVYVQDGGAEITLSGNIDLTGVTADSTNAVWVDADSSAYFDSVSVTGGSMIQE